MNQLLVVRQLRKSYKKGFIPQRVEVLKGLSFQIPERTVTGFLGGNGSGKTTTLKCILGLLRPDSGAVEFFGQKKLSADAFRDLGFLPEHPYFYDYLTGIEFLEFFGQLSGLQKGPQLRRNILDWLERLGLADSGGRPLRAYSKGMLQKIGLAQAILHKPKLLILDEPMSGLDPDGRMVVSEIIKEVAAQGTSVFFSSHLLADVERLCDRVIMIRQGESIFEGRLSDLMQASQQGFEIKFFEKDRLRTSVLASQDDVGKTIREIQDQGHIIHEVRPLRKSLEEIFVEKAIKGSPP